MSLCRIGRTVSSQCRRRFCIIATATVLRLEQNADILQALLPDAEILRFPAWDTVPYDRVSPNINLIARHYRYAGPVGG